MGKILFITGTDTGVGKTVVTALLLRHLRDAGINALAIKPFASGSRDDARLLCRLQDKALTLEEINPFFFKPPVAPAAAGAKIHIDSALRKIREVARRCDLLLVEGIGGLLVPLGGKVTVANLIARLRCPVLLVSANRLGTINHTLLSVNCLQAIGVKNIMIILVEIDPTDPSDRSNHKLIQKMAREIPLIRLPRIGLRASTAGSIKKNAKKLKIVLAQILSGVIFSVASPQKGRKAKRQKPLTAKSRRAKLSGHNEGI